MKFAVIIATYQRPDGKTPYYLKRTIDSVFAQKHQEFKLYVIGDKYENNKELFDLINQYPQEKIYCENLPYAKEREKYINNKRALWCSGGVNAFNYGNDLVVKDGFKYICNLDHDDYWTPDHLKFLNEVIEETKADWLCTKSIHIDSTLPKIESRERYIEFLPKPKGLIKSSSCINITTIPIRLRDVFGEGKGHPTPADADRWERISKYIQDNKLKSYFVNSLTCVHETEGYLKGEKIRKKV